MTDRTDNADNTDRRDQTEHTNHRNRPEDSPEHSSERSPDSRREFLKKVAAGTALASGIPTLLSASDSPRTEFIGPREPVSREAGSRRRVSPNDNIQLAVIGAGGMGMADVGTASRIPGVELVAVCDVYDGRLARAKEEHGADLFTTRNYREVLARDDVDAVIVGTPDHWHQHISIDALRSGKAVYCEKPMVHRVEQGHELVTAEQETGMTFQVGSQGMSSLGNEKAKELFEAGMIGELNYAEGFWARHSPMGAWQYPVPEDASEETVDWDMYLGDAPVRPFDPLRVFRWRNYRDYGTGVSGDLFVHLFSSLHFIVSSMGPEKILSTGGLRYWKDGREVPDVLLGMFDYPETAAHPPFNLSLRVNFVDGTSGSTFLRLVGSEGAMDITWTEVVLRRNVATDPMDAFAERKLGEMEPLRVQRARMLPPVESRYVVEDGYRGAHFDHFFNFFEGVRNGAAVTENTTFGFRAAAPALACNTSHFEDRIVRWDPENMRLL